MDTSKTGLPYFFVYLYLYLLFPFMLYFYFYVLLFFYNAGLWRKCRKLQWLIGSSMFVAASIAIHLLISCISTVKSHCFTNFQNPTRCKDSWIGFAVPASGIKRQGMKVRIQRSIPFTPLLTQLDLLVFTFCCHKKEMMEKKIKNLIIKSDQTQTEQRANKPSDKAGVLPHTCTAPTLDVTASLLCAGT